MIFSFPFPPRELSPNARVHWSVKQRAVRDYRRSCGVLARAEGVDRKTTPLFDKPVTAHVTFIVPTRHKRDEDNLLAALKPLWDGLVDARILEADDAAALHVICDGVIKGDKPEVKVEI